MVSMCWQSGPPGGQGKGTKAGCCCEPEKTGDKITKTKAKTKTKEDYQKYGWKLYCKVKEQLSQRKQVTGVR